MKICFISDTHNKLGFMKYYGGLPKADVLVHCGDATARGILPEIMDFVKELRHYAHQYKHVIFTPGNHDRYLEHTPYFGKALFNDIPNAHYLVDDLVELDGVKFYGAPWTPNFYNWAFMPERGEEMARKWAKIPDEVDVLVTHGPPYGYRDETGYIIGGEDRHVGCEELLKVVERVQPRIHAFGHIHNDYGITEKVWENGKQTTFVNCAVCDEGYKPTNAPIVLTFEK